MEVLIEHVHQNEDLLAYVSVFRISPTLNTDLLLSLSKNAKFQTEDRTEMPVQVSKQLLNSQTSRDWITPSCVVDSGATPLHIAALTTQPGTVEKLILSGAEVNIEDSWGATPLHYAAGFGCKDSGCILLKYGANASLVDYDLTTPLMMACKNGSKSMADLLTVYECGRPAVDSTGRSALHHSVCNSVFEIFIDLIIRTSETCPILSVTILNPTRVKGNQGGRLTRGKLAVPVDVHIVEQQWDVDSRR